MGNKSLFSCSSALSCVNESVVCARGDGSEARYSVNRLFIAPNGEEECGLFEKADRASR